MPAVDLRSDTLTQPTAAMRRAMAEAEVGDDVFGEDPTVRRLEEKAAERVGKEAALFVASGTMANLVSLLTHCRRGEEVLLGDQCHTFCYEQGGSAAVGGIHPHILPNLPDGTLELAALEAAVRPDNLHFPRTRLICLENTHNRCDGAPLSVAYMRAAADLAQRHGLTLHVDGARLFNAAIALGVEAAELAAPADSLSFCLSKGLGAPVGSVVCGSREFIQEARRNRKLLGGGMRQAGVLAAAGLVALEQMVERLAEDHDNARKLAAGLAEIDGIEIDPAKVRSNIVYFETEDAPQLVQDLERRGLRVLAVNPRRIRAVTYHHIQSADIDLALQAVSEEMKAK